MSETKTGSPEQLINLPPKKTSEINIDLSGDPRDVLTILAGRVKEDAIQIVLPKTQEQVAEAEQKKQKVLTVMRGDQSREQQRYQTINQEHGQKLDQLKTKSDQDKAKMKADRPAPPPKKKAIGGA